MYKKLIAGTLLASASFLSMNVYALNFGEPITANVVVTKPTPHHQLAAANNGKKEVTLMNIVLNPNEKRMVIDYRPKKNNTMRLSMGTNVPPAMNLGMNDVPVLDQGRHGTCVTFAVTAAIDAVLNRGDYISQLCSLELGSYMEKKGYMPSGWRGTLGSWSLDQILRFGVISKNSQESRSCANVTEYPWEDFENEGAPMSLGEFSRMSEDLTQKFYPVYHMNAFDRFDNHFSDTDQVEVVLLNVKKALTKGHRLTVGTLIVLSPYCSAGACANYHSTQDTWALTKELETPPYGMAGHEMVITGYDDRAVTIDQDGRKHQGLLTLRNSWGEDVGDQGNYYMTYDYFKKFVIEVAEIVPITDMME